MKLKLSSDIWKDTFYLNNQQSQDHEIFCVASLHYFLEYPFNKISKFLRGKGGGDPKTVQLNINELLIINMIYVPNFMKFDAFKLVSEANDKFYELKTKKKTKRRTFQWGGDPQIAQLNKNELISKHMTSMLDFISFHLFKLVSQVNVNFYESKTKKWPKIRKKTRKYKF